MILYIDLIFLENIIMNYIIIFTTGIICKTKIRQFRIMAASVVGAVYAIILYISRLKIYNSLILKILLTIVMVYISFNSKKLNNLLKQLVIFYLTSFCFGGTAYYLLYEINPNLIKSINGNLIGTYPIKMAIMGGILGFIIINISFKIIKTKLAKKDLIYNAQIIYKEKVVNIKVLLDTGNLLIEPITKIPVIIVEAEKLVSLVPIEVLNDIDKILKDNILDFVDEDIKSRCSIIPFSSIGKNSGMIIGFKPDCVKIKNDDEEEIMKKVIIGIYNNRISANGLYSGLIGLNLLNNTIRSGERNEYNSNIKV